MLNHSNTCDKVVLILIAKKSRLNSNNEVAGEHCHLLGRLRTVILFRVDIVGRNLLPSLSHGRRKVENVSHRDSQSGNDGNDHRQGSWIIKQFTMS